ncbi:hypothetical protein J1780_00350 [Rahnella aceris]|uniref:hypothetical protein n=1 Tax=Rahnella sp. (strain Y9602) TaxID=2703885 RepID=UPI001C274151|nr:hypothetical protein [Rahnella aceris]MBU9838421.1 hypothetical protein [Rahnella aceris]
MNKLENVIFGFDIPDIRAAFYYLSRYLKQADSIDEYEKDFFEDDFRSAPSEIAKKLTFSLIEFIEMQAGKKASEFNDQEYISWMNEINHVESGLDPEPSNEIKNSAESTIEELFLPEIGKQNDKNP